MKVAIVWNKAILGLHDSGGDKEISILVLIIVLCEGGGVY